MYPGPEMPSYGFGFEEPIKEEKESKIKGLIEKIKKGGKKIIIIGIVLVVVVWFLFLAPKPCTLRLNIVEMDGEKGIDADVSVMSAGEVVASGTASDGFIKLTNIPPGTVILQVIPTGYKEVSRTIELESGEERTLTIEVPKDVNLELPSEKNVTIGIGCSAGFNLEIRNVMDEAFNASFVVDGDLADWIDVENGTIGPKKSKTFKVRINVPADYELEDEYAEMSGTIRIKGTDLKTEIAAVVVPGGELDVDEDSISMEGKQGETVSYEVTISNRGVGKITDIRANASGDIADWMKLSIGKSTLEEDEETELKIRAEIPIDASEKTHRGRIHVYSGCGDSEIDVDIDVQALEIELQTDPKEISTDIYAGNGDTVNLIVANPSQVDVDVEIRVRGEIADWVDVSDETITIRAEDSEFLSVDIEPPYELPAGIYSGRIEIIYRDHKTNVPVQIEVLGEEE